MAIELAKSCLDLEHLTVKRVSEPVRACRTRQCQSSLARVLIQQHFVLRNISLEVVPIVSNLRLRQATSAGKAPLLSYLYSVP